MRRNSTKTITGTGPLGAGPFFAGVISVAGAGGIITQVILLRELLVGFYGNELTIGIILANWVLAEALGAGSGGWLAERLKNAAGFFVMLTIVFSAALPLAVYLARLFKPLLGIPFAEGVGLPIILLVSFIVLLPVAFCHGALFSVGAKILSSLGRMYAWETIGTAAGGLILTYLFLPRINSFSAFFITACAGLLSCLVFWKYLSKALKTVLSIFIALMLLLLLSGTANIFQRDSLQRQWQRQKILSYHNSPYGNIVVTSQSGQLTFFYNGQPTIVTPQPDTAFLEEFGNLPLLFHPLPRDILIIGGGAGGLIYEVLKHPEVKIDYTELDPGIIDALRRYPDQLTTRELNSPRLTLIKTDGRFFLQNTRRQYDLILIGVSRLSDLTEGRLFTKEFFDLTKKHLMSGGILALCLAGSPVYLSQDLKGINAALFNSLALTYPYLRIIPGDYNLHFASNRQEILEVTSSILTDRIVSRKIRTGLLVPEYLDYRLDPQKASWLIQSLSTVTKRTNQDLRPYAVFKTLVFWNRKFSPRLAGLLNSLENIGLGQMMAIIFILTAILLLLVRRLKQPMKLTLGWSIFTTGFFGMMVSLMLIFAFQVYTGYLYYKIGLLVSLFMVGSALGSIFIARMGNDPRRTKINFAWLELMILIFAFLCAGAIYALAHQAILGLMFFGLLSFASGLSLGLEFALASKIYLGERAKLGYACAALYGADLLGGWVAGITGGVFFLPILGIFNTCVTLALFKLSSLFLYLYGQNFSLAPKNQGVS